MCFLRSTDETKEEGESRVKAAVKALVKQHNKALGEQNLKGVMETYASAQNVVLMGTGPGETYVGDEAIRGAYVQFFKRHEANKYSEFQI